MSFSNSCACNFVPLMARVVLGGAFLTAGYSKVFMSTDFDQARLDQARGVSSTTDDMPGTTGAGEEDSALNGSATQWLDSVASWNPQGGADPGSGEAGQDPPDDAGTGDEGAEAESGDEELLQNMEQNIQGEGAAARTVNERRLYGIAIMLHDAGWENNNVALAWLTALTELIGGGLILIGLFSRIWGLGLAIAMGVAFYITTLTGSALPGDGLLTQQLAFLTEGESSYTNFNMMFSQLGLFVLAIGIFFTGPGALSVDRILFKSGNEDDVDIDLT